MAASAIWAVALPATVLNSALDLSSRIIAGLLFDNGELNCEGMQKQIVYSKKCNMFRTNL